MTSNTALILDAGHLPVKECTGGPSPPAGAAYHHYIFQLYALNAVLDLPATATRADVEKAMDGKIVARGAYTGKVKG